MVGIFHGYVTNNQMVFGTYGLLMISDFWTMKFIEILKDTGVQPSDMGILEPRAAKKHSREYSR